jgi:hypothetical protein
MSTQTLDIIDTLDDGYKDGASFNVTDGFFGGTNQCGLSFVTTASIPAGSTINAAHVRFYRTATQSWSNAVRVRVENADPASNTRFSGTHMPDVATYYASDSTISVNMIDYQNRYILGVADDLPIALGPRVQSLVTDFSGIPNGGRLNVCIDAATGADFASFEDLAAAGGHPAQFFIDWTAGGGGGATLMGTILT